MSLLVADPDLAVLIDYLLEVGLVRDVGVWTDEEAERCRLAAFFPDVGFVRSASAFVRLDRMNPVRGGQRAWVWRIAAQSGVTASLERFFHTFEPSDFALGVVPDLGLLEGLARGRKLPAKFRQGGKPNAKVRPWPELVAERRRAA